MIKFLAFFGLTIILFFVYTNYILQEKEAFFGGFNYTRPNYGFKIDNYRIPYMINRRNTPLNVNYGVDYNVDYNRKPQTFYGANYQYYVNPFDFDD